MKGPLLLDGSAYRIVFTESEFDAYVAELLPQLLERATTQTKRFLRETEQWENDTVHEKLAQRWGYELLERFLINGRGAVPCRPLPLLDSLIFKHYSQSDGLGFRKELSSPIGRFVDGLLSRAVYRRDAMTATFYHLYGFGQQQVAKILALGAVESQRVYKNYMRWRSRGWPQMVEEVGLNKLDLRHILEQKRRHPARFNREVERLIPMLQTHYRKSEPTHYPCLSRAQWRELYDEDCGHDYRGWHLPLCQSCLTEVWDLRKVAREGEAAPRINLQVHPLPKAAGFESY